MLYEHFQGLGMLRRLQSRDEDEKSACADRECGEGLVGEVWLVRGVVEA